MASMVPGRLAAGGLGAMGGAYAVTKGPDAVQGFLNEAFPAWVNAARAALQATPQVAPAAKDSAQVELLSASVKSLSAAVDGALRSQRAIVGGGAAGTLVLVGTPLAVLAYYLRNHGWWVTAQELQEGLEGVRQAVCERVEEARVQLLERIGVLEKLGEDTAAWQREQSAAMAEVAGKLHRVHDTVGALERELEGVKGDIARSARGVELLCKFVASSITARKKSADL